MRLKKIPHKLKITNFLALLTALVLVAQISCNKKVQDMVAPVKAEPPISFGDMLSCHRTNVWDSSSVHNKLIGKWKWEHIQCFWKPEDANNEDFKDLQVEFLSNNTLEVQQNGKPIQTSAWIVADLKDGFFKIDISPLEPLLLGRILFCDSLVLFYDSYVDGCDNYFKRTN